MPAIQGMCWKPPEVMRSMGSLGMYGIRDSGSTLGENAVIGSPPYYDMLMN